MDQIFNLPLVADRLNLSQSVLFLAPILAFIALETFSRLLAPRTSGVLGYADTNRGSSSSQFLVNVALALGVGVLITQIDPIIAIKATELFSIILGLIERVLIV